MTATKLTPRRVEKVWGRRDLAPWFADVPADCDPVGEVWFELPGGGEPELLVKFLFTSERLSVQVHPDDASARAAGHARGKDEAWVVLAAEPGATLGLGLTRPATRDELRTAALDGSIEMLLDWKPAKTGDVVYSRAGTVHALGPGLAIVEVQQNVDLTYRLYDYGRPRELHLDAGIAVSNPEPFSDKRTPRVHCSVRTVLTEGPAFVLERWTAEGRGLIEAHEPLWLIRPEEGAVWLLDGPTEWDFGSGGDTLVAYADPAVRQSLWSPA